MWQTPVVIMTGAAAAGVLIYKATRLLDFVVTTGVSPAGAERALTRSLEGFALRAGAGHTMEAQPRRSWSPHPAIVASVVESVGGSNISVRQRPRRFWWWTMFVTLVFFAVAKSWSYALQRPLSDELFTFSATWIYTWNHALPKIFAALLLAEAMTVVGGLWHSRWLIYRGENA